jgi:hypothetical protein
MRRFVIPIVVAGVLVLAALTGPEAVLAQSPPAPPAEGVKQLTETDVLKLDNSGLRIQAAQTQIALLQQVIRQAEQERAALIADFEQRHAGWTIGVNRQTGQWEAQKVAVPPSAAPAPAPPVKK